MRAPNKIVDFFEYSERDYKSLDFTDVELKSFEEFLAKYHLKDCFDFKRNEIKASHFVGSIRFQDKTINIYPKILSKDQREDDVSKNQMMENLLRMLTYTNKLKIKDNELSSFNYAHNSLLDFFIYLFSRDLLHTLNKELPFSYIKVSNNLHFIKGKIKFNENIKKNSQNPSRIFCEYHSFEHNNLLTITFKYVSQQLLQITKNKESKINLDRILKILDSVDSRPVTFHEAYNIKPSRNLNHFESALNFCKMFLGNSSFGLSTGAHSNYCIIFNMNEVFEEFIAEFINSNTNVLGIEKVVYQKEKYLFKSSQDLTNPSRVVKEKESRNLFQDIVVHFKSKKTLIIDTKYKKIEKVSNVSSSDIYQVMAYYQIERNLRNHNDILLLFPQGAHCILNRQETNGKDPFGVFIGTLALADLQTPVLVEKLKDIFAKICAP